MKSFLILLVGWNLISFLHCEEAYNQTEIKYPDVEATREHNRLLGVAVSVGLSMIFVLIFCISFTYYKLKEHHQHKLDDRHLIIGVEGLVIKNEEPIVIKNEEPNVTIRNELYVIMNEPTGISSNNPTSYTDQPSEENVKSVTQVTKF